MKKIITLLAAVVLIITCTLSIHSNPTGAPAGVTGGPAESGLTCTQNGCHNVSPVAVTGYITTDIPASGYVPKRTYNITVTFTGTGNKGFEMSAQDSIGGYVGKMIAGTGSQIVGTNYITHTAAKATSTATWKYTWTAPARGRGKFAFYGAFAITQNQTKKQNIIYTENKSTPLVATKPPTEVYTVMATMHADANAKTGAYKVSFQYRPNGGNWIFVNATPGDITGDSIVPASYNLTGLTLGTRYTYRACMWNAGDTTWGDSVNFTTSLNSGLAKLDVLNALSIYPQPASDIMHIRYQLNQPEHVQVMLYTLNGARVFEQSLGKQETGVNIADLNLNMPKGIYLLELKAGENSYFRKVIVE